MTFQEGSILDGLSPDRQREVARILIQVYEPIENVRKDSERVESLLRQALEIAPSETISDCIASALTAVVAGRQEAQRDTILVHGLIGTICGYGLVDLEKISSGQTRHQETT